MTSTMNQSIARKNRTETRPIRLLFVGGYGRSGSTLLDRLLGEVDGVCSLGEVRHIWKEGLVENRRCGCGAAFSDCSRWGAVIEAAFGPGGVDGAEVVALQRKVDQWWKIPSLARSGEDPDLRRYADLLTRLYLAAADVSGARVLVDSSKDVSHGYVLHHLDAGIDLRILHLIRDPRAVAHSWQRHKHNPGSDRPMDRWPPWRTAIEWNTINALTSASRHLGHPYLRLRYEDLTSDPSHTVGRILGFVGEDEAPSPIGPDGRAVLSAGHTVAGNPDRFRTGPTRVVADEAWRDRLRGRDRIAVTGLSGGSLLRYGYPLGAMGARRASTHV